MFIELLLKSLFTQLKLKIKFMFCQCHINLKPKKNI
jgi:hypothetical protein